MLIRHSDEYINWRKLVFERDNYKCIFCKKSGYLNSDHILPFVFYPELRFDVNNGRTLCKKCHLKTNTFAIRNDFIRSNLLKKRHESQRGFFAYYLFLEMAKNSNIYLIVGDLGYNIFDKIKEYFPYRFINVGASEQLACGICIGLAQEGKIPIYYSISSFGFFRPVEWIRNFVNNEKSLIKMVFSGQNKDYSKDGFTHWAHDIKPHLDLFPNIKQYWPKSKEEINEDFIKEFLYNNKPCFLSLKR